MSSYQLHAVSRTQQGMKPNVKTLRFPEFWRHCVLSDGTKPARAKILIYNNSPRVGIEPSTSRVYSHTLVPLRYRSGSYKLM